MKNRKMGQKIAFFFSLFSYFLALLTIVFGVYWWLNNGTEDPIFASAIASVIFFFSCGAVLQVVANANLPDLTIKSKSNL